MTLLKHFLCVVLVSLLAGCVREAKFHEITPAEAQFVGVWQSAPRDAGTGVTSTFKLSIVKSFEEDKPRIDAILEEEYSSENIFSRIFADVFGEPTRFAIQFIRIDGNKATSDTKNAIIPVKSDILMELDPADADKLRLRINSASQTVEALLGDWSKLDLVFKRVDYGPKPGWFPGS